MNYDRGGAFFDKKVDNEKYKKDVENEPVTALQRIDHFTWANFTNPMATGGIALLLADQPHTFRGLETIGKVVYIFDLVIFVLFTGLILTRFIRRPSAFTGSLRHSTESLFFPTFFLTFPTIISCMVKYGVPSTGEWFVTTCLVLFWVYAGVTFLSAVFQYEYLFRGHELTVQGMTPGWLLPIFPIMLCGTIASALAPVLSEKERLPVMIGGLTFQGLGFWTAMIIYPIYIMRLMQYGLPNPALRPGMFIAVGPFSFTAVAAIGISSHIPTSYGYFAAHPASVEIVQTLALVFALFAWTLSFWFFCISTISCIAAIPHMDFHLVWYAFVFPNTGLTIAVIDIGEQLGSQGIMWVGSVMSILLVVVWLFVMVMHARAFYKKDIMMPGKDEDKDD